MGNNFSTKFSDAAEYISPFFIFCCVFWIPWCMIAILNFEGYVAFLVIMILMIIYFFLFYNNKEYWFGTEYIYKVKDKNDNEREASLLLLNPIGFPLKPVIDSQGILTNIKLKYWGFLILSLLYWLICIGIYSIFFYFKIQHLKLYLSMIFIIPLMFYLFVLVGIGISALNKFIRKKINKEN